MTVTSAWAVLVTCAPCPLSPTQSAANIFPCSSWRVGFALSGRDIIALTLVFSSNLQQFSLQHGWEKQDTLSP